MKNLLIILSFLFISSNVSIGQNEICETCVEYTLELYDNKLQGSSLQFAGYDVSMNLPLDFSKDNLSINNLFSLIRDQDIRGEFIFPNGKTTVSVRRTTLPGSISGVRL